MLSIVIPTYNEEGNIERTSHVIRQIMENEKILCEVIFVDDGSKDNTWEKIKYEFYANSNNVRGISFSRNFGKEAAIYAGLAESGGNCAVVIDCDLQHPPEKIVEMYRLWEEGYEIVEGVKSDRGKEHVVYGLASKLFYEIMCNTTGIDMMNSSDFKLLDRKAINVILNMKEKNSFFRALSSWIGFKTAKVYYEVRNRAVGESKWSRKALIKYAISNITSFTSIPLYIVIVLGILMFLTGVIISIEALFKWMMGIALEGFTTVIILQCFSSSIIMISIGIVGYYVSKIYEDIKNRPKYIISKKLDHGENICNTQR